MSRAPHIVCHTIRFDEEILQRLSTVDGITVEGVKDIDGFSKAVEKADGVIVSGFAYDKKVADALCEQGKNVRWIQFTSSGIDTFLRHGGPANVAVCNAASAWGQGVAEHAFAMLLSLSRGIVHLERARIRKDWDQKNILTHVTGLEGQTAVIIGCGEIGKSIASRSAAFGMKTIGVNRSGASVSGFHQTTPISELGQALGMADVVFVCVPLTEDTKALVAAKQFELMVRCPIFINVARGPVIDQAALELALKDGRIRAAGLDVFVPEPLPSDSGLWNLENVILSPHISGQGDPNVLKRIAELCAENASRLRGGDPLLSQVSIAE